jgi:hypothetical protein
MEHLEIAEKLESYAKAELASAEAAEVARHLGGCEICRADLEIERSLLLGFSELRVVARTGFAQEVAASLPSPHWGRQKPISWAWPVAAMVTFTLAAVGLGIGSSSALSSLVSTLTDLAATSLLAGAGLLGATWRGFGLAVRSAFAGHPVALLGLAAACGASFFGLYRFLLRPRWARAPRAPRS